MNFNQVVQECRRAEGNIRYINVKYHQIQSAVGAGYTIQAACENVKLADLEVLGIDIKDEHTLTIIV